MRAVFYDLETTSKNTVGQILNYSFIFVDDDYSVIDELSGLIRISRLQLPEPGAVLANRTDVLEHQQTAVDSEPEAMRKIFSFLSHCLERAKGALAFVGYNSSKFDLGYLRTCFIRNGINPYFGGLLTTRDILHVVQKAYLTHAPFRSAVVQGCIGNKRLSLSMQTVTKALGLLEGVQAHESREDVLLTIRLAQWLHRECGIDSRTYEAYEGLRLHSTVKTGSVYTMEEPEYDLMADSHVKRTPVCLLDANGKSALWINLERYGENQNAHCIMWRQVAKHSFFTSGQADPNRDVQGLARRALGQFQKVDLKNYFSKSTCDIEQDIYRVDFAALEVFGRALEQGKREILAESPNTELKVLWIRRQLAHGDLDLSEPRAAEVLRQYALYRYGGKLQLVRTVSHPESPDNFHPTLREMVDDLSRLRDGAVATGEQGDVKLLDSLEAFYRSSDIARVAGGDLLPGLGRTAA